jgi:hypothetical protein
MTRRTPAVIAAATVATLALLWAGEPLYAQGPAPSSPEARPVRVEARFVDRASGQEAAWGATGQILVPAAPAFNERLDSPKLLASLSQLADTLNYGLV